MNHVRVTHQHTRAEFRPFAIEQRGQYTKYKTCKQPQTKNFGKTQNRISFHEFYDIKRFVFTRALFDFNGIKS